MSCAKCKAAYVPLVHDVNEWGEIIVVWIGTVNVAVNSNKPDSLLWKEHLGVKPYFQIIPPQAAHILHNQGSDPVFFNIRQQRLKTWTLEIGSGVSVVGVMAEIAVTVVLCIILEIFLLVQDAVAFALQFIVPGQPFI